MMNIRTEGFSLRQIDPSRAELFPEEIAQSRARVSRSDKSSILIQVNSQRDPLAALSDRITYPVRYSLEIWNSDFCK